MRRVIAVIALSVCLISPGVRAAEPDAVQVAAARAAWAWASVPAEPARPTAAPAQTTHTARAAWAWASVPACECGGTEPDCRCKNDAVAKVDRLDKPAEPVLVPPKPGACDRCPCGDGKSKCECSSSCPSIYRDYGAARDAATKEQKRIVVFIGPVAPRAVPGCVVAAVHTLEGSGAKRIMVGVPGRPDGQLARFDFAATATDQQLLAAGAVPVTNPTVAGQFYAPAASRMK